MAFWRSLLGVLTGASYRQDGLQSGLPSSSPAIPSVPVNTDIALQISAVWSAVRLISETIAAMPINVYSVDQNGVRTLNKDHYLHKLFHGGKINRWQTKQEYFETINYQKVLLGNNFSLIQRNGRGEIIGLVPLMAEQMEVELLPSGEKLFKYIDRGLQTVFKENEIWHNKCLGNGIIGLSPLAYARNSIGIAVGAERSVTDIYRNGGKPSGILSIDKPLTQEQRQKIKENFAEIADGNNQRLFVLEGGMKFERSSLSPQDIELLSSRRFQIEEIARWFGVPSILINDMSNTSAFGSGVEKIMSFWYFTGLQAYLERYEASIKAWLLKPEERSVIDVEFDFTRLIRADFYDRIKAGKEAVQGGLMTPNEWRFDEGFAPLAGGDVLLVQQQMIPIEKAGLVRVQNEQKSKDQI